MLKESLLSRIGYRLLEPDTYNQVVCSQKAFELHSCKAALKQSPVALGQLRN